MKKMKLATLKMFFISSLIFLMTACSSRLETPVIEDDLTIVYPSKKASGISAKITLYRKVEKKTGNLLGSGTIFTIREKANLRAVVDLENLYNNTYKDLMFHFDWIGPNGKSFYLKRVDLAHNDSTSMINSSISISPEQRQPGEYILRIYFFRELIAEKKFEILPKFKFNPSKNEGITTGITLYRKKSKKTGKLIGEGTVFKIKEKTKVRALVELENRSAYGDQELMIRYEWIGPDGNSFYRKQIDLFPGDSTSIIRSSISIPPEKRQPGKYSLRVYLYDTLIAEKEFELHRNK